MRVLIEVRCGSVQEVARDDGPGEEVMVFVADHDPPPYLEEYGVAPVPEARMDELLAETREMIEAAAKKTREEGGP